MIGFKDMTFCDAPCDTTNCFRKYTTEVGERAQKWWGGPDAPIAMADFSSVCPDFTVGFPDELEMDGGV